MHAELVLKTLMMGVVEGITEFLPVSSTGHLILAGNALSFLAKEKRDVFEVFIQFGAMLAVIWEYRARLASVVVSAHADQGSRRFLVNLAIAFMPAAVLGLLIGSHVQRLLFSPGPVAVALVVGGIAILWAERRPLQVKAERAEQISRIDALKIGFVQCLALWPGTSRSGATIIGGLWFGASRQAATEFSFFLGIPILGAASVYNLFKHWGALSSDDIGVFAMGFIASFAFALLAIRLLMRYLTVHGFGVFAWYRIALGTLILVAVAT